MKPIAEMLRYLSHPAITELALTTGRCPMIKSLNGYEPVDNAVLTADELNRTLLAMVGPARAASVTEKPVKWSVRAEGMATLSIIAARRGELLSLRVMRTGDSPAAVPGARPAEAAPEAPAAAEAPAGDPGAPVAPNIPPIRPSSVGMKVIKASAPQVQPPTLQPSAAAPSPPPRVEFWKDLPSLMEEARRLGASDLHVVAGRPALFRVASELKPEGEVLSPEKVEQMLLPQVPARLRPVLEKEGSCDFSLEDPSSGRFRVNVCRQRTGLKGSFRVISREIPTLESLGLPPSIAKAAHHHQGLIVVTGPSGHGKTSTLTAIVDLINRESKHHVLTVEDPVEYLHPRKQALLSQREVGTHTRTFANALKGSLREDPDVIVVGELRDTETVRMALAASETGHLLISTMNTPSAAKTIDRLIDLFPPGDQAQVRLTLASSLRLIVSQRLLPSTDGKGLVAAAEVLPGSVALGNLIRDNKTFQIPSLQQRGKSLGIIRFDDSLAELVKAGKTTLEIARGFAESPDELEAVVTGKRPGAPQPEAPAQDGQKLMNKVGSLLGRRSA
ncbi:PilT/PilU family type 4a pilus ATPase [Stigmatella sp. ncwal1]|uniref:PilT/PilU family type 4a pilus ATPase n=1 Tax=Stigmatella ashevillensis TaxID=2995309 RepID=A0ABT5DH80_9BACT|nr:PilT/PilU family type 4a pilus ATPase [Stigmatella ashevillena]MDC0713020.1 PilT/PilU family type 4a pilus ATPase [Stigmatella ashevillena]